MAMDFSWAGGGNFRITIRNPGGGLFKDVFFCIFVFICYLAFLVGTGEKNHFQIVPQGSNHLMEPKYFAFGGEWTTQSSTDVR